MAEESRLEASVHVDAAPDDVWHLVTDITRMGEWSPQCRGGRWIGREHGPVVGARFVGINRQGWKWWATTNRVVQAEPGRLFAFRTEQNRARWVFRLEPDGDGTTLVQRRELPAGRPVLSYGLVWALLGGHRRFDTGMQAGIRQTLERIKAVAEAR
jgi:uncharacterized protein YndB with AHSA1/START domain